MHEERLPAEESWLGQDWLGQDWLGRWILRLPAIERPILFLRWFSLVLVLVLDIFDRSDSGVLLSVHYMAVIVAGYNAVLLFLMRYVRRLRGPLNYLALDTLITTTAVYLTGGYHSSFFVLYAFIAIGAAIHLELTRTVAVTLAIGLIYVGACYVNPSGLESPYAQYILSAKLLLLLLVAVLCSLLVEQLRREHQETERERALAQRLAALNDLFQQLNTTLDLDVTLQTVAQAPRAYSGADLTSIALLDRGGRELSVAAAAGLDSGSDEEPATSPGPGWSIDHTLAAKVLALGQPLVVNRPSDHREELAAALSRPDAIQRVLSVVLVPLLLDERPLGVLNVAYCRPRQGTALGDEDLAFLRALGHEAALAIRNARLYELEREQVARLRALDELQEAFVSAVSHELRTPLTCIKTSVDLLQTQRATAGGVPPGGLAGAEDDLVDTIAHHVGRLEALVADLLEVTRLEAGQITLSTQPTDLRVIVNRVVDTLRPLSDQKNQIVRSHQPEQGRQIELDRRRIEQALTNILSNAIKFTPKGGRIEVDVEDLGGDLQVCVRDSGPGIREEDLDRVFDRFYVASDRRGLSGVGLGLYIARQMIELHGGRIWAKSRLGEGCTFCFTLPVASQEAMG